MKEFLANAAQVQVEINKDLNEKKESQETQFQSLDVKEIQFSGEKKREETSILK